MSKEELFNMFFDNLNQFHEAINSNKGDYDLCNLYINSFYSFLDRFKDKLKEIESEE